MTENELEVYRQAVDAAKDLASRSSIVTPVRFEVSTENGLTQIVCPACGAWKVSTPPNADAPEVFLHRDPGCAVLRELQAVWRAFLIDDGGVRA